MFLKNICIIFIFIRDMIIHGEEEYHRRGHFERLFPIPEGRKYLVYYQKPRNEMIYYIEFLEELYNITPDPVIKTLTLRRDEYDDIKDEKGMYFLFNL